jgi:hypothetical protein
VFEKNGFALKVKINLKPQGSPLSWKMLSAWSYKKGGRGTASATASVKRKASNTQ